MINQVKEIFDSLDIKAIYHSFKGKQEFPYVVILSTGQNDVCADDTVIESMLLYRCELYNDKKDETLELSIKKAFINASIIPEISYSSFEDNGKNVLITYYEIEMEEEYGKG